VRANNAAVLSLRDHLHRAAHAHVPVGGFHFVQQQNIDVVGAQLFAEAIQIGFDVGGRCRICLGEDYHLLARYLFQCLAEVGVAAVLVGGIPEVDALVERGSEQLRDALVPEFSRLIGTAVSAVRSSAHREPAKFDAARAKRNSVGSVFFGRAGEQVIRKRVERKSAESAGPKEMPPVHGASALIAV